MGTDRDDELARTATAPASGSASIRPADPIGSTLGRYKLEREIGQGGMGVVHAAFDPDLERRVALKVLRSADGSSEARQRLLREARAMARLAHPNVVTVHEVASANGRDYVAMELIEGQSLAEWMREASRPENEIIDAFVAAGRGLAAAHAEGIVHRDFKPHNVLRRRDGRIAVTDFGLARESEAGVADPLAITGVVRQPVAGTPVSTSTPSSPLAGLTVTGSVLGTPAYMAPEQWSGGAVTPASDQFAFCVALWEALAGERPFKGATVEMLREEVKAGPAKLDFSKIPRRLRPALLRGLDPDPKRRWPSMDALLRAMQGAENKSKALYIVAGAAIAASAVVLVAIKLAGGGAPAAAPVPACRAPAVPLDVVWPGDAHAKLAKLGQRPAADQIEADVRTWRAAREHACTLDATKREANLACLDGVLARIDAIARGLEPLAGKDQVDAGVLLVDPNVCLRETLPRLSTTATPQLRAAIAGVLLDAATPGRAKPDVAQALIEKAKGDPCAGVYARYLAIKASTPADRERVLVEANEEHERCRDDRVRLEFALINAELALESGSLGTTITSKVKLAELAADTVPQADVAAALDSYRTEIARRADQLDTAITRGETAAKKYAERNRVASEVGVMLKVVEIRRTRATLEDLASIQPTLDQLRARAVEKLGAADEAVRDIDVQIADWKWANGDIEGATKGFAATYKAKPNDPARRIKGRVVDAKGAPVAGARVVVDKALGGNAYTIAIVPSGTLRETTTGPDGTFEIPDAVEFGTIVAAAGELRSQPILLADTVELKLEPTSTISGRVDLRGEAPQSVAVIAIDPDKPDMRYGWASPILKDGTFLIGGVPKKKLKVFATVDRGASRLGVTASVDTRNGPAKDIKIDVQSSKRVVHVVVRSTINMPVGNAAVLVMRGKVPTMTARQMRSTLSGINERMARQIEGEHAPAPVVKVAKPGDLFATMSDVAEGAASACGVALPADLADPQLGKKIDANLDKLIITCVPIPEGAEAVVVEVPPFPRLD